MAQYNYLMEAKYLKTRLSLDVYDKLTLVNEHLKVLPEEAYK